MTQKRAWILPDLGEWPQAAASVLRWKLGVRARYSQMFLSVPIQLASGMQGDRRSWQ